MNRKSFERFARKKPRLFIVAGAVLLLLLVAVLLPASAWYKREMRAWWESTNRNPFLAYYLNFDDPDMAMWVGDYYFNGGAYDLARARASYEKAIAIDPTIARAHYELGRIDFVNDDFTDAQHNLDIELEEYPDNLRPLYIRGLVDLAQYNFPAAQADFTRFVAWAPTEWAGYNDLAFTFAQEEEYPQSEAAVREAFSHVAAATQNAWLWNSLGLAQLNELRYTQAQRSFKEALALAQGLTLQRWIEAYPGDDPSAAQQSIAAFQNAVRNNLANAQTE